MYHCLVSETSGHEEDAEVLRRGQDLFEHLERCAGRVSTYRAIFRLSRF
jgi:hypothetical protein